MKNHHIVIFTYLKRTIKIMNLILIMLLIGFMQISATTYAQVATISIHVKNEPLENVLKNIEGQSEFLFFYNTEEVNKNEKITLDKTDSSITEVLDDINRETGISYSIKDRHIVLTAHAEPTKDVNIIQQVAKKSVAGTITDDTGEPIIGANVIEKGTTNGVITDIDGRFTLSVSPNAVLLVSYIGYLTQEITVKNQTNLFITLREDTQALDEVVVVGYGTQKKINLTGAVAQISSDNLENRPITNVEQALQGVSPGLNISISSKYGGEVGSPMDLNIRGIGSLTDGSGSPYVLVDGVPMDLSLVNPADIESISVLKDAASSAIYGARAAYGVILVTTKRGRKGEKFAISYNANVGWKTPTTLLETVNSLDYATAINQSCANSGIAPRYSESVMELMQQYIKNPGSLPGIFPEPGNPTKWGEYDQTYANTNWMDVYYKDWSFQQNHDVSISGSTDKSMFYIGLGLVDTDGQLNFFDENYKRYNVTVNNDAQLNSWLKVKLNTKFVRSDKKVPVGYGGTDRTVNYHMMTRAYPTLPVYDPNGNFTESCNVGQILSEGGAEKQTNLSVYVTPGFEISLGNDFKINGDLTYNYEGYKRNTHYAKINVGNVDGESTHIHHANNFNRIEEKHSFVSYTTGNLYANYFKQLDKHALGVLLGGQIEYHDTSNLTGSKRDLITDEIPAIGTATGVSQLSDELSEWSTVGTFMRFNYSFDDRYLLEFNGRYDGSSRFRKGKRWGFFPSVSVGYNISREAFWKPLEAYINTFKLRASYGTLGNQEVPNYLHIETLPIKTNLGFPIGGGRPVYTLAPDLVSRDLTWEESRTLNFGLDVSSLNNRLLATFDWYTRETVNMFGPSEAYPAILGKDAPLKNNASLRTNGFELSVTWKNRVSKDFSYSVTGILSDNKTKVTKYNNPTRIISSKTYYKGQKLGDIWGYETDRLFTSEEDVKQAADQSALYAVWKPGDMKYKDLNNDGIIDWGDNTVDNPGDKKVIGNNTPRYMYGLSFSGMYKNFDFNVFFQGIGKRDVFVGATTYFGFQSSKFFTNVFKQNLDYWTEGNPNAFFARPYATSEVNKNQQTQSRFLQNGAYLRLKNLQIGYTVPGAILSAVGIERLRFYVSGENLLTFTKLMDGVDPECTQGHYGDAKSYPASLVCSFGLNLTF